MPADEEEPPIHHRHFTIEEAGAELARLRPILQELRAAKSELTDAEAHEALGAAAPTNGGGHHGLQVGGAFLQVRRLLLELAEIGVVMRDIDRGLIDFPAYRDGREIYLCWHLGEREISTWHELDAGYSKRRRL